ncbi:MAG: heme-binding protein [Haloferacaceae archaeon]
MREPPQTDEGWFALHDFRTVDWDAWRDAPERERERAVEGAVDYLQAHEAVEDAADGASAVFAMLGHKADLMVVHFRPTLDDLSAAERRFDRTAFGGFTEQSTSYVSVTEVSGYVSTDYFEGDADDVDEGLRRYIDMKLKPDVPDDQYACFYPMSRKRGESDNWYDLPFEERRAMMEEHGKHGREFAGQVKQVVASSVGLDDWEWGVTLFSEEATTLKDIVYEMRFDEASARYSEFGPFYVGRRFPPTDLQAFLDGEKVPTGEADAAEASGHPHGAGGHGSGDHPDGEGGHGGDGPPSSDQDDGAGGDIRGELTDLNIYAGQPHGEDVYATVLYSEADPDELFDEVQGLRANFDHYDTHVKTAVYDARDRDRRAVVSIWDTESAAETAAGFLSELPDVVSRAGEESGFGTMGMFYTVKPDYRDDFAEKFEEVGGLLADMEGHQGTDLMVNVEDENDMFIASQWRSKDDAMAFFRSEAFSDTVSWGRDVLADRPRHVFLA